MILARAMIDLKFAFEKHGNARVKVFRMTSQQWDQLVEELGAEFRYVNARRGEEPQFLGVPIQFKTVAQP